MDLTAGGGLEDADPDGADAGGPAQVDPDHPQLVGAQVDLDRLAAVDADGGAPDGAEVAPEGERPAGLGEQERVGAGSKRADPAA